MVNAMCFVFFISAFTSGQAKFWQVFLPIVFVVPYKMFARYILECACIYTGSYDERKNEADDGDLDPLNNATTAFTFISELVGTIASIVLNILSIFMVFIGVLLLVAYGTSPVEFVENWGYSQAVSIIVTEIVFMTFFVFLNKTVFGHQAMFEKKWKPYYDARNLEVPVSISEVAMLARDEYIIENGIVMFYQKFASYDKWFLLEKVEGAPSVLETGPQSQQVLASHEDIVLSGQLDPTGGRVYANPMMAHQPPSPPKPQAYTYRDQVPSPAATPIYAAPPPRGVTAMPSKAGIARAPRGPPLAAVRK